MKSIFLFLLMSIMYYNYCYGQTTKKKIIANTTYSKNDTLAILKKITFCNCVTLSFPEDSLEYKDPSMYILIEQISCSLDFLDSISIFIDKYLKPYKIRRPGQHIENTAKPSIMLGCINMYNSKELEAFLRIFYRKNREMFPKLQE